MLRVFFLLSFAGGLGLAVYAMLHGVERSTVRRSPRPSPVFNTSTAAAFLVGAGAAGYLVATRTRLGAVAILVFPVLAGAVAVGGMIALLAGWALRKKPNSHIQEEELQGQFARVTRAITSTSPGEIFYTLSGIPQLVPARSIRGIDIAPESEVVIESVENGIAHVELWSVVEQRL